MADVTETAENAALKAAGIEGRYEVLPAERLRPNPWNPNRMDDRTMQATRQSLATYGFIAPVIVRPHPDHDGDYQIIDGEHRWKVQQEENRALVPCVVLELDDVAAYKLTIIFNETRGEPDDIALGTLLAQIKEADPDGWRVGLRYGDGEVAHLLNLADQDWQGFGEPEPPEPPPDDGDPGVGIITCRVHPDFADTWDQVRERMQTQDGAEFDTDPTVRAGQMLERLAAHYLNMPS